MDITITMRSYLHFTYFSLFVYIQKFTCKLYQTYPNIPILALALHRSQPVTLAMTSRAATVVSWEALQHEASTESSSRRQQATSHNASTEAKAKACLQGAQPKPAVAKPPSTPATSPPRCGKRFLGIELADRQVVFRCQSLWQRVPRSGSSNP